MLGALGVLGYGAGSPRSILGVRFSPSSQRVWFAVTMLCGQSWHRTALTLHSEKSDGCLLVRGLCQLPWAFVRTPIPLPSKRGWEGASWRSHLSSNMLHSRALGTISPLRTSPEQLPLPPKKNQRGYIRISMLWVTVTTSGVFPTIPPCPNMGLSEHGDPVFLQCWPFFGTIVFAVPIPKRMWFVALWRLQEGSIWVTKCVCSCNSRCSCVLGCMLACWTPFCCDEGVGLAYVCKMCSVLRAAQ